MISTTSAVIIVGYIIATVIISLKINSNKKNRGDFSTGNRQFGWIPTGMSALATYVSAMTFIGMPGWVYSDGLEAIQLHLNYPIVIFFTIVFFIPIFYKLGLSSIYEYLELRFGVLVRTTNAIAFLFVQCLSSGIVLYTIALILVNILPLTIVQAIVITSLFTAAYSYCGGITTVIWTDVLQSLVLIAGAVAVFVALINNIHDIATLSAYPEKFIAIDTDISFQDDTTVWSGLVAMSFLHLSVFATNQLIIQRTLAARSVEQAQKAMLICGYGSFFIYLFFALIGILLFCFYDGQAFTNSNEIILNFVFDHTNPVVIGLVISSLMAAAMSSLDSAYNSMSTVMTFDIYKRFMRKNEEKSHYERVARRLSLLCSILIIFPSILAISNESVLKSVASLAAIFVGVRLGSFLLGMLSRTTNEAGALIASMASMISIVGIDHMGVAWPWFALFGTGVFLLVGYTASRYVGSLSAQQIAFIDQQKDYYCSPARRDYALLVFFVATIVFTMFSPYLLPQLAGRVFF